VRLADQFLNLSAVSCCIYQEMQFNAGQSDGGRPIDAECACMVCQRHSRGYVRHLFQVGEPTALRLVSWHNVSWTLQLMDRMSSAIRGGTFGALRRDVLDVWG